MVDTEWCVWYTVGEYKKSSKQKIILYRNNHTIHTVLTNRIV